MENNLFNIQSIEKSSNHLEKYMNVLNENEKKHTLSAEQSVGKLMIPVLLDEYSQLKKDHPTFENFEKLPLNIQTKFINLHNDIMKTTILLTNNGINIDNENPIIDFVKDKINNIREKFTSTSQSNKNKKLDL